MINNDVGKTLLKTIYLSFPVVNAENTRRFFKNLYDIGGKRVLFPLVYRRPIYQNRRMKVLSLAGCLVYSHPHPGDGYSHCG